ncbi:MAG: hypothetical protein HOA15_08160 [Candidatus Marinimicrobia bacterium]|jgi:hypothetical protein|nr:hypothetical protein [Candidatus Neomarinimicrobiota bacterium]MBT3676024.1 hypothetical protein [Candidatus Neomarinimicrobiota bacterium]MBT4068607.1 hypothetical protein [Candidatus Neomarinimicrobiota bacterium]MBT4271705.1 hypothetical protein [Candidatus Neomarinimicrobiota bacterium]MBT4371933.1 hypothetical protein [Candidatus Neomarinimicrobiota bacterium]
MNKTRSFLVSGLATMTLIITLIETGFLNLESQPLIAQGEVTGLILEKDGEQVLIPLEEWIVVVSAYDPTASVGGALLGMTNDALRIQEKGQSFERELPINEIGSIFIGKTKSTRDYVFQGMKVAGIGTMGGGLLIGAVMGAQDNMGIGVGLLCGAMIGGFYSIFTIPAGALIGYMRGQAAQGNAIEYVIGPGEWTIVQQ